MIAEFRNAQTREKPAPPADWARLIRKLRWIGLDEQATQLERVVSTLPPEERDSGLLDPLETD